MEQMLTSEVGSICNEGLGSPPQKIGAGKEYKKDKELSKATLD